MVSTMALLTCLWQLCTVHTGKPTVQSEFLRLYTLRPQFEFSITLHAPTSSQIIQTPVKMRKYIELQIWKAIVQKFRRILSLFLWTILTSSVLSISIIAGLLPTVLVALHLLLILWFRNLFKAIENQNCLKQQQKCVGKLRKSTEAGVKKSWKACISPSFWNNVQQNAFLTTNKSQREKEKESSREKRGKRRRERKKEGESVCVLTARRKGGLSRVRRLKIESTSTCL